MKKTDENQNLERFRGILDITKEMMGNMKYMLFSFLYSS